MTQPWTDEHERLLAEYRGFCEQALCIEPSDDGVIYLPADLGQSLYGDNGICVQIENHRKMAPPSAIEVHERFCQSSDTCSWWWLR